MGFFHDHVGPAGGRCCVQEGAPAKKDGCPCRRARARRLAAAATTVLGTGSVTTATAEEYTFELTIGDVFTQAGSYRMCYCNPETDDTPTGADVSYSLSADTRCASVMTPGAGNAADVCSTKCSRGCIGPDCNCDGYSADAAIPFDTADALCLKPADCIAACTATAGCTGVTLLASMPNVCFLNDATDCSTADPSADLWVQGTGAVCTSPEDYSTDIGSVTVTDRPSLDGDWVLTPGEAQSLEVVGDRLDPLRDRLYVTWASGTCGFSAPVGASAGFYTRNAPVDFSFDPPMDDFEGPYAAPVVKKATYRVIEKTFCGGPAAKAADDRGMGAVAGVKLPLAEVPGADRCWTKCAAGNAGAGADGDATCAGLMNGYDGPSSVVLCLAKKDCLDACTEADGCYGIAMHATLPRCYMYTDTCRGMVLDGKLSSDESYDFYYKQDGGVRRLQAAPPASWGKLLRFPGLNLEGGRYKACFCDSKVSGLCKKIEDYTVDVGSVHVSGVSCLLGDAKYTRGVCVPQAYGGLRCHTAAPSLTEPTPVADTVTKPNSTMFKPKAVAPPTEEESTWCLYGPEEDTLVHPICQFVLPVEEE